RTAVHVGLRFVRAVRPPEVRRRHDDPEFWLRRPGVRTGGQADLGRHLRARRTQGRAARRRAARTAASEQRRADGAPGRVRAASCQVLQARIAQAGQASTDVPGRPPDRSDELPKTTPVSWVSGHSRSRARLPCAAAGGAAAKLTARGSALRQADWLLISVVLALTLLGTLLIWSATQPMLIQQGANPHTYLLKQLLNIALGLALMVVVSSL